MGIEKVVDTGVRLFYVIYDSAQLLFSFFTSEVDPIFADTLHLPEGMLNIEMLFGYGIMAIMLILAIKVMLS